MKNPYIAARPSRVPDDKLDFAEKALAETGNNTGNLLFFSAVRRIVKHDRPSFSMSFNPTQVREHHDGIVIPAANWLNSTGDFGGLANIIEASGLPCVVVGLGAQSYSSEKYPKLTDGTKRFLSVLSDRAASLSVRGEYTADVLLNNGIKNVDVTGCPSLLWHVDRPARIGAKPTEVRSIAMNGTRSDNDPDLLKPGSVYGIGLLISRYAFRKKIDYVLQTELSEMQILWGEASTISVQAIERLKKIYQSKDIEGIKSYINDSIKVFTNVESWMEYLVTKDLIVGTRLHGAIAAVLCGRPAILVAHDTRTKEMADWACLPTVPAKTFLDRGSVDFDAEYEELDVDKFNVRQLGYYEDFKSFFTKNGVATNLI